MTTLKAAVFLRRRATRIGPFRFGHVGWAFQVTSGPGADGGLWSAGAIENWGGRPVASARAADFWAELVADPFGPMRARRYDEYKLIETVTASPAAAWRAQQRIGDRTYVILFANCVDAVAAIVGAFGGRLPSARRRPIPTDWYDAIPAPSILLPRAPALGRAHLLNDRL